LFVLGLRKNLLLISVMEDKGYVVEFKNQQVLIKLKESTLEVAQVIQVREGYLYRLQGEPIRALVHNTDNLCELWHKRMGHSHHKALPILRKIVTVLPDFNIEYAEGARLPSMPRLLNQEASISLRRFLT
jgi:hypothetical protein